MPQAPSRVRRNDRLDAAVRDDELGAVFLAEWRFSRFIDG